MTPADMLCGKKHRGLEECLRRKNLLLWLGQEKEE
jgi:hypothetical protein